MVEGNEDEDDAEAEFDDDDDDDDVDDDDRVGSVDSFASVKASVAEFIDCRTNCLRRTRTIAGSASIAAQSWSVSDRRSRTQRRLCCKPLPRNASSAQSSDPSWSTRCLSVDVHANENGKRVETRTQEARRRKQADHTSLETQILARFRWAHRREASRAKIPPSRS